MIVTITNEEVMRLIGIDTHNGVIYLVPDWNNMKMKTQMKKVAADKAVKGKKMPMKTEKPTAKKKSTK